MRRTERFLCFGSWLFIVLVNLSLTPLFQHRMEAGRASNGLTREYREFAIGGNTAKIEKQGITYSDLVELLQERGKPYVLLRMQSSNCYTCVASNKAPGFPLLWGRMMNEQDYSSGADVALVSSSVEEQIHWEGGVPIIRIDGYDYDVIGVYRKESNKVNKQPDFFINGLSDGACIKSPYINGIYCLDTEDVDGILCCLDVWCGISVRKTPYQKTDGEKWEDAASVMVFSVKLVVLVTVFSTVAFWVIAVLWLRNLRNEIRVHRICGSTGKQVRRWIGGKYIRSVAVGAAATLPIVPAFRLDLSSEVVSLGIVIVVFAVVFGTVTMSVSGKIAG